jgi:hypothetical protein
LVGSVLLIFLVFCVVFLVGSVFLIFLVFWVVLLRSLFRVTMSVTISVSKRCSCRLYLQLSYLRYLF